MNRLLEIQKEIKKLYHENPDDKVNWLYESHVKVVAEFSKKVAKSTKADAEICILAALFHDIARTKGMWDDPDLMDRSLAMAENIMNKHGYKKERINAVKEAILFHSCKEGKPRTKEGKVLATADALAHLMTDFYIILPFKKLHIAKDYESYKKWVLRKIERDFRRKIFFPEYKKLAKKRYEALKLIFGGRTDGTDNPR